MYSKTRWLTKLGPVGLMLVFATSLSAQMRVHPMFRFVEPFALDEARELFNAASDYYSEGKFAQAEKTLRDVLRKFRRNQIADRSTYLLARTLVRLERARDAVTALQGFEKSFPKSEWLSDVRELRLELTGNIP